jgi:hypothetical protein
MRLESRSQFLVYAASITAMIFVGLGYLNLLDPLKPIDQLIVVTSFCLTGLLFVAQALRGTDPGTSQD